MCVAKKAEAIENKARDMKLHGLPVRLAVIRVPMRIVLTTG